MHRLTWRNLAEPLLESLTRTLRQRAKGNSRLCFALETANKALEAGAA